jgi:hypothetical protein
MRDNVSEQRRSEEFYKNLPKEPYNLYCSSNIIRAIGEWVDGTR